MAYREPLPAPQRAREQVAVPTVSASAYFAEASAIDLFELRAADIALDRGSAQVKAIARESQKQHRAIAAQLSFAGRYLNLLPSTVLPPEYQQMLSALLAASSVDALYLAQQRRVSARALKLHSDYARAGTSPTLRPVAKFATQAVNSELAVLRR